jgi:lipopolysaccharide/colanic/teichoic acid biosynthesis glycosyltransferase
MYRKLIKRLIDISLSLVLIIVLIPVWVPICIILLLTGEHSVFYTQKRVGHNSRTFYLWKYRTMVKNSEKMHGGLYTIRNDPRVLPFGNFLRKNKLDEIPQLFHILTGKMSFVGPRPLVVDNPYPTNLQHEIYKIKPGVTGIGSIVFRNEEQLLSDSVIDIEEYYTDHILPYKATLELWYHQNISFSTDIKIIFSTLIVLLFPNSRLPFMLFYSLPSAPRTLKLNVAV